MSLNRQSLELQAAVQRGAPLQTRRSDVLGQLIFCEGCCCGRVDRGFPELPKDLIKQRWKAAKLNDTIQLTISGCLGPCDVANVACICSADGELTWLGALGELWHYETLIAWAERCQFERQLLPLPASLLPYRFERFLLRELRAT